MNHVRLYLTPLVITLCAALLITTLFHTPNTAEAGPLRNMAARHRARVENRQSFRAEHGVRPLAFFAKRQHRMATNSQQVSAACQCDCNCPDCTCAVQTGVNSICPTCPQQLTELQRLEQLDTTAANVRQQIQARMEQLKARGGETENAVNSKVFESKVIDLPGAPHTESPRPQFAPANAPRVSASAAPQVYFCSVMGGEVRGEKLSLQINKRTGEVAVIVCTDGVCKPVPVELSRLANSAAFVLTPVRSIEAGSKVESVGGSEPATVNTKDK